MLGSKDWRRQKQEKGVTRKGKKGKEIFCRRHYNTAWTFKRKVGVCPKERVEHADRTPLGVVCACVSLDSLIVERIDRTYIIIVGEINTEVYALYSAWCEERGREAEKQAGLSTGNG